MKTYFTVIPALFTETGEPIQDLKEMTALAIVAVNHLGLHVYTVKGKGWDKSVWDDAYTELSMFNKSASKALPDYSLVFTPPCSISARECDSETGMIGRFFHDMKLLGLNTLHSWNLVFDIDCMDYTCKQKDVELQGIMEATMPQYFSGRKDSLMTLNTYTSKEDRGIPTTGNVQFSDGLTEIGMPLLGGMKGSMALTSVYREITGHQYYPYQFTGKKDIGRGLEVVRDLQKEFPASFVAEEMIVLYQNTMLNVIYQERYPDDT